MDCMGLTGWGSTEAILVESAVLATVFICESVIGRPVDASYTLPLMVIVFFLTPTVCSFGILMSQ